MELSYIPDWKPLEAVTSQPEQFMYMCGSMSNGVLIHAYKRRDHGTIHLDNQLNCYSYNGSLPQPFAPANLATELKRVGVAPK